MLRLALALFFLASGAHAQETPPALRLPDGVRPLGYKAELTIRPDSNAFSGRLEIEVEIERPTAIFWLNADQLRVDAARIGAQEARIVAGGRDFVGLRVDAPLPAGRTSMRLEYRGEVSPRDTHGVFRQREAGEWYVFTQFEPFHARRAFPSFDEPQHKVPWQLSLVVPRDHVAVSNTPALSETELPDGMKRVAFARTRPLPSYLIAFGVGPFDVVDGGTAGMKKTQLRYIVPRGRGADTGYAVKVTPRLLEMSEEYTGIPYPYEKLDSLAIPTRVGGGAMENPGLITYTMALMVARPQDESPRTRQAYAHVAAHEIAHMWFGNLVTHAWWDDLWLNESFATWMSAAIIARFEPEWEIRAKEALNRNWAMKGDSLLSARRIRQPIQNRGDIANAFDSITYAKGSAVLEMFESWIGAEKFRAILRAYLEKHADGVANASDFLAALRAGAGPEAGEAFASFLEQAGLPLVSMELQCRPGDARIRLTQRRYLPLGARGQPAPQVWRMPVCVLHDGRRACTLMSGETGELPLGKDCPAHFTAEPARYYRAEYRGKAPPAAAKTFDAVTEIGDLQALAANGALPLAAALARLEPYAARDSRDVVQGLVDAMVELRPLVPPELQPNYARWILRLFGTQAAALGLESRPGDSEDRQRLRPSLAWLVATDGGDAALRMLARRHALRWLDDRSAVDASMIETVLIAAAHAGDRDLFQRYRAAIATTSDRRERRLLFIGLGSFADPAIARDALALVLDPSLDYREASQIAWTMSERPGGAVLAYEFMKANFDAMAARAPTDSAAFFPRFGRHFCDEAQRADLEGFFSERAPRSVGGPRILAQTLERISLCAAFKQRQQASFASFLKRY